MNITERNRAIEAYLKENPIEEGKYGCYIDASQIFNVSTDTIRGIYRRMKFRENALVTKPIEPVNKEQTIEESVNKSFTEDLKSGDAKTTITGLTTEVKTLEDLVKVCNIDLTQYRVDSWKCSAWNGFDKEKGRVINYSVNADLKRLDTLPDIRLTQFESSIREELLKSINKEDRIKIPSQIPSKKSLIVYFADMHIGAYNSAEAMYANNYNKEVVFLRMKETLNEILRQKEIYGRFEKIILMNLGDALDGWSGQTTRGGHKLPQNMDNGGQFDTFVDTHRWLIDCLVDYDICNEIEYIATYQDNHSYSFSYIALRAFQIYCEVKYPFIKFNLTNKFLDHFYYGKHAIIYTHGKDSSDRKVGLPLNLDDKTEVFINDYIYNKSIDAPNIHLIKADLHQSSTNFAKRFRYKNVLSFYGSSKWIQNNFGTTRCGVEFEIFERDSDRYYSSQLIFK